jgi:hypothetical protein
MTPEQAAHETRGAIVRVASGFMTDPATYARGHELGFEGADLYFAGRGGVLGDVGAEVVAATFVFFAPPFVKDAWDRSGLVMSRRRAAEAWSMRAHEWSEEHLTQDVDWPSFAELLGRVVEAAPVAGAPLFAGWRALPAPESPRALVLHRMNALRELRGAIHGAAILTVGLAPLDAIAVHTPERLPIYGWTEPAPDPEPLRDRWALAEARTDRLFGRRLAVLDETERKELVELCAILAP